MTGLLKVASAGLLIAASMLPSTTLALGELPAESLIAVCSSEQTTDQDVCQAYLGGFVDGALTTDPTVAVNVVNEAQRSTDALTERAIRTRVRDRLAQFGASVYAEFCPPNPLPIEALSQALVTRAAEPGSPELARDLLYEVVRSEYPCR